MLICLAKAVAFCMPACWRQTQPAIRHTCASVCPSHILAQVLCFDWLCSNVNASLASQHFYQNPMSTWKPHPTHRHEGTKDLLWTYAKPFWIPGTTRWRPSQQSNSIINIITAIIPCLFLIRGNVSPIKINEGGREEVIGRTWCLTLHWLKSTVPTAPKASGKCILYVAWVLF